MPIAEVGDTATHETVIDRAAIESFANATGDQNPIHLDDEYAAETMFQGRIAHGILTAGVISAALAALPGDVIYLSQSLDFEAPVRPGETVRAEVEVLESLGSERIRVKTTAHVDDRDENERVIDGTAVVLSVPHDR